MTDEVAKRPKRDTVPVNFGFKRLPCGIREAIARVCEGSDLSADETAEVFGEVMEDRTTPAQIGALLAGLRLKGETVDEVVGAARAMRARMAPVPFHAPVLVDTCGTGGDGSGSVNVSTLAAIVAAACGLKVAKHGNRALSSRAGSHDVIEALGLDPAPSAELAARCLREIGIAFLFAPHFHAATRFAAGPRRELGIRTIFNLLGPLTNPAGTRFAVNGIFAEDRCELLAKAHRALGTEAAMVVHGAGSFDEIVPAGPTFVAELRDGVVRTYQLTPADFGLRETDPVGLKGGDAQQNARILTEALNGVPGPVRNVALMTAASALHVAGQVADLVEGARRAADAIDDGRALTVLERLRAVAPRP